MSYGLCSRSVLLLLYNDKRLITISRHHPVNTKLATGTNQIVSGGVPLVFTSVLTVRRQLLNNGINYKLLFFQIY